MCFVPIKNQNAKFTFLLIVSFGCPVNMNALLAVRPLLPVTSASLKGLTSLKPYSQRIKKIRRILPKPTDPGVKPFSDIPGPPSLPIIGTLLDYYRGKYSLQRPYVTYSEFLEAYGPLVKERVFFGHTLVHVFDPQDFRTIYLSEEIPIHHSHKALKKYRESRKDLYGHVGLPCSNGEEWIEYRKLFEPLHSKHLNFTKLHRSVEPIADDLVEYMKSNLDHNGEISLSPTLNYYTLECLGLFVLGKRLGCFDQDRGDDINRLIQAVHESHYAVHQTEIKPYILARKAYKTLEISQDYIANFVLKHMDDILDLMELESIKHPVDETATNKDLVMDSSNPFTVSDSFLYQKLKRGMTKPMLLPMAVDLFQAGIHSTANSLAFAMYHLARNPDKQEILREELIRNLPNKTGRWYGVPNHKPSISYMPAIIKESLRLNPPTIGTGRVLDQDLALSGYLVPKGTKVITHHEVASKHKDYYPDPLKFIPGRNIEFGLASSPFVSPFKRSCLGFIFALNQMNLAMIKVFRAFEVSYHYKEVGVVNYLVNEPDQPIKLRLKEIPDDVHKQDGTTQNHVEPKD